MCEEIMMSENWRRMLAAQLRPGDYARIGATNDDATEFELEGRIESVEPQPGTTDVMGWPISGGVVVKMAGGRLHLRDIETVLVRGLIGARPSRIHTRIARSNEIAAEVAEMRERIDIVRTVDPESLAEPLLAILEHCEALRLTRAQGSVTTKQIRDLIRNKLA